MKSPKSTASKGYAKNSRQLVATTLDGTASIVKEKEMVCKNWTGRLVLAAMRRELCKAWRKTDG